MAEEKSPIPILRFYQKNSYLAAQGGRKEQRGKILSGSGENEQRKSKKIEGK